MRFDPHLLVLAVAIPLTPSALSQTEPRARPDRMAMAVVAKALEANPFTWLRESRGRAAATEEEKERIGEELRPAWSAVLHAALWNDDLQVAFAAASRLHESELDVAEITRWVEVVTPHLFENDLAFDWGDFKHLVSSEQIARLLVEPPTWGSEVRYFLISDLHRSLRPEHIPALCRLWRHDDPFLREQAVAWTLGLTAFTRRHREDVARALLAWPGPKALAKDHADERALSVAPSPREFELPPARAGWSPLLRAALERGLLDARADDDPTAQTMLLRWADDETPAPADRLLLRALLDSRAVEGKVVALRGFMRLPPDPYVAAVLATATEELPREMVLAARHDTAALRELATTDASALAMALEVDFDGTWTPWVGVAFGDDAAAGLAAITRLADAVEAARSGWYREPLRLADRVHDAVVAFGARLDFARMDALVRSFPAARSRPLLERYFAAVTPALVAECDGPALEVAFGDAFTGRLREWARIADGDDRAAALSMLRRLGDTELGQEILDHWCATETDLQYRDPMPLARCRAAAPVAAFLRTQLGAVAVPADGSPVEVAGLRLLAAAAVRDDLPEATARGWALALEHADQAFVAAHFDAWRRQVLDGDPIDALVEFVAGPSPIGDVVWDLGQAKDERVVEVLQRIRRTPGANVQWAIGELSVAGDRDAIAEIGEVRHLALYGWFDDAPEAVWTGGRCLDYVPWILGELETICCRRNSAAAALESLLGYDVFEVHENALLTQREAAQRWWDEVHDRLRWSEIAGHYEVAPR